MPLPEGVPKRTVTTGKPLITPGGTPYQGYLQFTGPGLVTVGPLELVLGGEEPAYLTAGLFSIDLVPNDLDGMNPSGWTYKVDGVFSNAPGFTRYITVGSGVTALQIADVLLPDPVAGAFTVLVDPASLGTAAFLNVGQVAGTVAAGDDDRFGQGGGGSGPSPSSTVTASTSFGQSSAPGSATAYSRGDHVHGTPAAPTKSTVGLGNVDNTSDASKPVSTATSTAIGSVSTALTTHTAATTTVHGIADTSVLVTTADSRLTNSRTPSGAAGGDLGGTFPNPSVAKVAGVAVSGTAASGKVLTASSSSAASWQTPSGGGGSAGVSSDGRINEEIIVLAAAADWTIVTTSLGVEIGVTVAASVGNRIWFSPSFLRTGGVVFLDMGIKAAAGGVSRYISSGESTPREQGYAPLYPLVSFTGVVGIREFIVQAGEVDGDGNVKIVLAYKGPADGNQSLYFGGGYDGAIWTNNPDA